MPVCVADWKESAPERFGWNHGVWASQKKVKLASAFKFEHFLGRQIIYGVLVVQSRLLLESSIHPLSGPMASHESLSVRDAYFDEMKGFSKECITRDAVSQTSVRIS